MQFPHAQNGFEGRPYMEKDEGNVMEPNKASLPHFLVTLDHIII
jgi:hypothetical protein